MTEVDVRFSGVFLWTSLRINNREVYFMISGELMYDLVEAQTTEELLIIWKLHHHITKDFKLMICLETYETEIFSEKLTTYSENSQTDLIAYFPSKDVILLDDENIDSMIQNDTVKIPLDYSIMMDTNYTSYINKFVSGKLTNVPESVYSTIDYLLRNEFNYDYYIYLFENYSNLFESGEKEFSTTNKEHISFYENLFNLELFKSIDTSQYINNKIEYTISSNEAHFNASELIDKILKSKELNKMHVYQQKAMTLFLIGVWQIQFKSKQSAKNKARQLLDYMTQKVGVYFEREFIIAYKYFDNPNSVSMLNNINKGVNYKDLYKKIENISWDFMIPRIMENQISVNKTNYFYPFILSHDKKFKELLRLFSIKGFLYNKEKLEAYPIPSLNTNKYFEEMGLIDAINVFSNAESKQHRNKVKDYNIETEFVILQTELEILENLISPNYKKTKVSK